LRPFARFDGRPVGLRPLSVNLQGAHHAIQPFIGFILLYLESAILYPDMDKTG
jgi:hypothetical protein